MKTKKTKRKITKSRLEAHVPIEWFEGLVKAWELVEGNLVSRKYLEGYIDSARGIIGITYSIPTTKKKRV